jgi:hypothetical protein
LINEGNTQILVKDCKSEYHFNGNFNNVNSLRDALKALPEEYSKLVKQDAEVVCQIFEDIFNHKSFTGRSGTFFGYEGLGSIYWHMVSKLLLATFEITKKAIDQKQDDKLIGRLFDHYFEINAGIGAHKSPKLYGAFPTDPYSHTPGGKGAQQPGMTGQVKEDILSRFGELGVRVQNGVLFFDPTVLRTSEFLEQPQQFDYVDTNQNSQSILIEKDSLGFTYCQVPVVYSKATTPKIEVFYSNGSSKKIEGIQLDRETTTHIFRRTAHVQKLVVHVVK